MKVLTFGGGTIRTEFEVMTGMLMDAFPKRSSRTSRWCATTSRASSAN